MAKQSTTIKKVRTDLTEFKSEGIIKLDENGMLIIDTDDFGSFNLIDVMNELELLNQNVKIQVALKLEDSEEISPLEVQEAVQSI